MCLHIQILVLDVFDALGSGLLVCALSPSPAGFCVHFQQPVLLSNNDELVCFFP